MPLGDTVNVTPTVQQQSGPVRSIAQPGRGIFHAIVTVRAGLATQVPSSPRTRTITVQAATGNAGVVYIGDKNVTNAAGAKGGYALDKGEALQEIPVERPSELWVAGDTAGDILVVFGVM